MVVVSYSGKEINAKLVYYGAGLSGKTTNLEAIYEAVPDTSRGKMVSMKTQSDRTLFFDLLPLDLGEIMGFKTRFLLYTVPGQVFYNATRKLVLKGADAIVFVADSEVGKMEENKESLENLRANLAEYKLKLDEIPWVIQYNKRDLPNVYTLDELNAEVNPGARVPFFEAVATQGQGVFETFRGISHLLMEKVTKDLRRTPTSMPAREPAKPATPAPARPAASSAPPMAPGRVIEREAKQGEPVFNGANEPNPMEYGRQIELPDMIPPNAPARPAAPVGAGSAAPAPAPSMGTAAKQGTSAPAPAQPWPARPRPAAPPAPGPSVLPIATATAATTTEPATAAVESPKTIVVPITMPPAGKTGEIVIRIVLKAA